MLKRAKKLNAIKRESSMNANVNVIAPAVSPLYTMIFFDLPY